MKPIIKSRLIYINKKIIIGIIILLGLFFPYEKAIAEIHSWKEVQPQEEGRQLWDENSLKIYNDKTISVLSRFISRPNTNDQSISEDTYLMKIDCIQKIFANKNHNHSLFLLDYYLNIGFLCVLD